MIRYGLAQLNHHLVGSLFDLNLLQNLLNLLNLLNINRWNMLQDRYEHSRFGNERRSSAPGNTQVLPVGHVEQMADDQDLRRPDILLHVFLDIHGVKTGNKLRPNVGENVYYIVRRQKGHSDGVL